MSSLPRHAPAVHSKFAPLLRVVAPPACPAAVDRGYPASLMCDLTFADPERFCPGCKARLDRAIAQAAAIKPEPDAPGEARIPFADWIEVQASTIRLSRTEAAEWLAAKIDELAAECRSLRAETPDQFDGRSEVMQAGPLEDERRYLEDSDSYPYVRCG